MIFQKFQHFLLERFNEIWTIKNRLLDGFVLASSSLLKDLLATSFVLKDSRTVFSLDSSHIAAQTNRKQSETYGQNFSVLRNYCTEII